VLALVTQATAATKQDQATEATRATKAQAARAEPAPRTLDERLAAKVDAVLKHRGTVRFFETRPWLLRSKAKGAWARASLRRAEKLLAEATQARERLRRKVRAREARRLSKLRPRAAICEVFGGYCRQAVAVAWCESRLDPAAQNGQYLGLFQMGSYARSLFGHGQHPHTQAQAAHAYFVRSGRNWSPWTCKPGHAYQ